MPTLIELYQQNPFWIWMGVGAVFIALDIASGVGRLIWPALAAGVVALVDLAGVRAGVAAELAIFALFTLAGVGLSLVLGRGARTGGPGRGRSKAQEPMTTGAPEPQGAARLIGRIGRASEAFVGGVGRVSIDDMEWGAEMEGGEQALPAEAPVRVLGVSGADRLRVRSLS